MASSDLRYGSNTQNTSKYMQDLLNEFNKSCIYFEVFWVLLP